MITPQVRERDEVADAAASAVLAQLSEGTERRKAAASILTSLASRTSLREKTVPWALPSLLKTLTESQSLHRLELDDALDSSLSACVEAIAALSAGPARPNLPFLTACALVEQTAAYLVGSQLTEGKVHAVRALANFAALYPDESMVQTIEKEVASVRDVPKHPYTALECLGCLISVESAAGPLAVAEAVRLLACLTGMPGLKTPICALSSALLEVMSASWLPRSARGHAAQSVVDLAKDSSLVPRLRANPQAMPALEKACVVPGEVGELAMQAIALLQESKAKESGPITDFFLLVFTALIMTLVMLACFKFCEAFSLRDLFV